MVWFGMGSLGPFIVKVYFVGGVFGGHKEHDDNAMVLVSIAGTFSTTGLYCWPADGDTVYFLDILRVQCTVQVKFPPEFCKIDR